MSAPEPGSETLLSASASQRQSAGRALLRAAGIWKDYVHGDRVEHVLRGVELTVRRGEFVAIMGPSGCGKTTLLNILGLMSTPTRADALALAGQSCVDLDDRSRTALRRQYIGFVFQRFNLMSSISAVSNVRLALSLKGIAVDGQADRVLDRVGLAAIKHRKPGSMSIGEQQRVAIARAVACNPRLLLADEPTGNLDSDNARTVLALLRECHAAYDLTTVMITHNEEVAAAADRVLRMRDGRFEP
jgi:ABC-type lipoprotein export system ATPase subunit